MPKFIDNLWHDLMIQKQIILNLKDILNVFLLHLMILLFKFNDI